MEFKNNKKLRIFIYGVTLVIATFLIGTTIFDIKMYSYSYVNTNLTEWQKAFKEVADAYYMRGVNLQYNSMKVAYNSPEETTSQNMNYLVCSGLIRNIYKELFPALHDVEIPEITNELLEYGKENAGTKSVVAYGSKDNNKDLVMILYDPNKGNSKEIKNPNLLEDVLPFLQPGDILTFGWYTTSEDTNITSYSAHTVILYDLIYENGKIIDAEIMQSVHGPTGGFIKTKIQKPITIDAQTNNNKTIAEQKLFSRSSANHFLYYNELSGESTVNKSKLSDMENWNKISDKNSSKGEYSILRLVHTNPDGSLVYINGNEKKNIVLTEQNKSRIKFSKLYIEKTVDKHANNVVSAEDELTYTIIIKNNSDAAYSEKIKVIENISEFVNVKNQGGGTLNGNTLQWTINELGPGKSSKIMYTVKIKNNNYGKTIESTGTVANIASTKIKNTIGNNLNAADADKIKTEYNKLLNNSNYNGKKLINEIYKQALNIELDFDKFDISELIYNFPLYDRDPSTIKLIETNEFYFAVLNNYWSSMFQRDNTYSYFDKNGNIAKEKITEYSLKQWGDYPTESTRADTIYEETFKTGDILIYNNYNDILYSYDKGNHMLNQTKRTYENGEYAYIFIQGEGFVGKNLGNDGIAEDSLTSDDRNKFNADYYTTKRANVYSFTSKGYNENIYGPKNSIIAEKSILKYIDIVKFANYQTLFAKDNYVILRPSLLPKEIEITTKPAKTAYIQKEEKLDLTGGILTVKFLNGESDTVNLTDKSVKIDGFNNSNLGINTLTVEYKGKKTTLPVTIVLKKNSNNFLSNIKIEGLEFAFKKDTTEYILTAPYDKTSITISADVEDKNSTLTGTGIKELKEGINTFYLVVTSEDKKTKTYKLTITRLGKNEPLSSNTNLKNLIVTNHNIEFHSNITAYSIALGEHETELDLSYITEDKASIVTVTGNHDLKIGSVISISVTSTDGSIKEYTINIIESNKVVEEKKADISQVILSIISIVVIAGSVAVFMLKFLKRKKL